MKRIYTLLFLLLLCLAAKQTLAQMTAPGNALDFAGDNDFVLVAPGAGIVPTSGDYTIALWAKHNALQSGTFFELFSQGNPIYFGGDTDGNIRIGDNWISTGVPYPADFAWHHFTIVRSGTNGYLYIDGTLMTSTSGFPAAAATTFKLGNQYSPHLEYFNGQIDEFSVWSRALSLCEIKAYMITELAGTETGLVAYYNFDQGSAGGDNTAISTLTDITGTNNGTLNNFTLNGATSNFVSSEAMIRGKIFVNKDATGCNTGTSWTDAYTSFQSALDSAISGDTIWVAKGTYKPGYDYGLGGGSRYNHFRMLDGVAIYGGFTGTETTLNERTDFRAGGANETILSADLNGDDVVTGAGVTLAFANNSENCYHVFYHPSGIGLTGTSLLDGFSIIGGNANGSGNHSNGGAIINENATISLNNINMRGNYSAYVGGAICNSGSAVFISNSVMNDNWCLVGGGAMYSINSPTSTFTNVLIAQNKSEGSGGGLQTNNSAYTLTNVTVVFNYSASLGGGLYAAYKPMALYNSILWGNTAVSGGNQAGNFSGGGFTLFNSCYANGASDIYLNGGSFTPSVCITSDPLFVNVPAGDYRILGNSPCADAGNNSYNVTPYDVRGNARIQNTTIDMGAYEWTTLMDPIAPVVSCPSNTLVNNDAGDCGAVVNFPAATATGDPTPVITYDPPAGSFFPLGITTVTATATNTYGSDQCTFNVEVIDNEAPVITCPGFIINPIDPGLCTAVITITNATATDNCSVASVTGIRSDALPLTDPYPRGVTSITWTATDDAGNTTNCTQYIEVFDNVYPSITCPGNISVINDPGTCGAVITFTAPVGTDNCQGVVTNQTNGFPSGSFYPLGTTMATFTATDAQGHSTSCSFDITVTDAELPVITCPSNMSVNNDAGLCTATISITSATATDNCGSAAVFGARSDALALTDPYPLGTTNITWTAIDQTGNFNTCVQSVAVADNEAPTITCPGNINVINDPGVCSAMVNYTAPTGIDNCSGAITSQTAGLASGSIFPMGTTTNTFLVTDAKGMTASCSFDVTVTDTEAPIIACPAGGNQTASSNSTDFCSYVHSGTGWDATATDNCTLSGIGYTMTGATSGSGLSLNGVVFNLGVTTITWTATDSKGNASNCSYTATVNVGDAGPRIYVKNDAIGCNNGTSWTNAYSSFQSALNAASSGDTIWVAKGTYKPSYDYGLGGGSRYYHFRMKSGVAIYGGFAGNETALSERTDFGNGGANETILSADLNGDDVVTGAGQTLSFSNNSENCYHVFYHPIGLGLISTAILDGFTLKGGNANGSNPMSDGGAMYNRSSSPALVNLFITENYSIYSGGGISNASATPSLTNVFLCRNKNEVAGGGMYSLDGGTINLMHVVVTGNYSNGSGGGMSSNNTIYNFTNATIANNYSATLGGGLYAAYRNFYLNNCIVWGNDAGINGKQMSGFSNGNMSFDYSCFSNGPGDFYDQTDYGTHNYLISTNSINTDPQFVNAAGNDFRILGNSPCVNSGMNSYNAKPYDIRGNARIQNTTIDMGAYEWTTLMDPIAPVVTCPSNTMVNIDAGACGAVVNFTAATATGDPAPVITYSQVSGTGFPVGITAVTVTATNPYGSDQCTFNVEVTDNEAPVISCPSNINICQTAGQGGAAITYSTPAGTDNCEGAATVQTAGLSSGSLYPVGTTVNTFEVTDAAGLKAICSFTVTVNPVFVFVETHAICDGANYAWHGQNLTTAGTYHDNHLSANGCDSTYTLTLSVNPVYAFTETHAICDGANYAWHGQNLTAAGTYHDNHLSANGCDSTYTLTLSVNPVYAFTETHAICDGATYPWHGQNLTAAGTYHDNHLTANGCDSTYTLTLTVNPVYAFTETHAICDGATYPWHGQNLTAAGTYHDNHLTAYGCDSTYTLTLTVNTVNTGLTVNDPIITANAIADNYQWLDCDNAFAPINGATSQNFTAIANGNYAVIITQGSCLDTSICIHIITVGISSVSISDVDIYPNPVGNELIIEAKGNTEKIYIEIFNAAGQLVFKKDLIEKAIVQTNNFATGVYIVKIKQGEILEYRKIIKN